MTSTSLDDENHAIFYIGQHEPGREYAVTDEVLRYAQQECDYDMLTAPITTDIFNKRVLSVLLPYLKIGTPELNSPKSTAQPPLSTYQLSPTLGSLNYPQDTKLAPSTSTPQLIFTSSPWIDLSSPDPVIADISNQVLQLEIQYAAFCGATNVVVHGPRMRNGQCAPEGISQYARAIQDALKSAPFVQVSLLLEMYGWESTSAYQHQGDLAHYAREGYTWRMTGGDGTVPDKYQSWDIWNTVRTVCKYNARLSVALTVPPTLPPLSLQSRWYSEPLRILHLPATCFPLNNKGALSLSPSHSQLLQKYMRLRNAPWILLSEVAPLPGMCNYDTSALTSTAQSTPSLFLNTDPTPGEAANMLTSNQRAKRITTHVECLRLLQTKLPPKSPMERFGAGYQDFLQNPLQPLSDNLESITYEVFEKDPVKYDWYERAIAYALSDWKAKLKPASGPSGRVVLAVVGAGRGPLVVRAIQASVQAGVELDLWALEKNQNAFVLLQKRNQQDWNGQVNIVQADMRSWTGPSRPSEMDHPSSNSLTSQQRNGTSEHNSYFVDIFVSELLGSFGDNELSPECLDGVQRLLNPRHGISIPCSYSSHLTPVAAPKLHTDILTRTASMDADAYQTPCVVFLQAVDMLSTHPPSRLPPEAEGFHPQRFRSDPVPTVHLVWEFDHPSSAFDVPIPTAPSGNRHNRRFRKLDFHCRDRGVCHGLAGYFETVLYDPGLTEGPIQSKSAKVELSTNPLTMDLKSKDMISWFPIYFPLKTPLYFPDNTLLSVSMWRQTDGRKVWYEWMVESFMLLDSDKDGNQKVERLGVTDLHSSIASGCLL